MEKNIGKLENNICNIMQLCERSQLVSFEYEDCKIRIKFSKNINTGLNNDRCQSNVEDGSSDIFESHFHSGLDEVVTTSLTQCNVDNEIKKELFTIKSPYVGTIEFSKKIKLCSGNVAVTKGDVVCSIEAMKLYNDIKSPVTGTIEQILVEDYSLVEFEQPIFRVRIDKNE